jgi:hypothetical protein
MSARILRDSRTFPAYLVLRVSKENSAEFPKESGALCPELVLRDVPGKSSQGAGHPPPRRPVTRPRGRRRSSANARRTPRWGRRVGLRRTLLDPPAYVVVGVRRAPRGLGPPPALPPALGRGTRPLTVAHSRIRQEPPVADRAGLRAARHRRVEPHPPSARRRQGSIELGSAAEMDPQRARGHRPRLVVHFRGRPSKQAAMSPALSTTPVGAVVADAPSPPVSAASVGAEGWVNSREQTRVNSHER